MSQRERRLRLFAVLPGLVLGILAFQPSLSTGGDNAEYLMLARSLATRHDYSAISGPVVRPETQRPPGTPAFYAALMMLAGERLWLLKSVTLLTMLLAAWLAWPVLRMQAGSTAWASLAGVVLFLANWQALGVGVVTGSEMPYTTLTLLALLGIARYMGHRDITTVRPRHAGWSPADDGRRYLWLALATVATAGAIYVRPNGVTLIPALGLYLLLHRQWRGLAIGCVACGLLLAPLAVMQHQAAETQGVTYGSFANTVETSEGERKLTGLGDLARRTFQTAAAQTLNLGEIIIARPESFSLRPRPVVYSPEELPPSAIAQTSTPPAAHRLSLRSLRYLFRYLLGLLVVSGLVITWRGSGGVLHWYMVMNILMLVLTPFPRGRYLLPLLPMWGWFLAMVLTWLSRRLFRDDGERLGQIAIAGVLVAAVLCTAVGGAQQTLVNLENRGLPYYAATRYACEGTDYVNYAAAADWLKRSTPPKAVIVCRKPYNMYWITGRASTWDPLWEADPEQLWQRMVTLARYGPVFIVQDGFLNRFHGELTERNLIPALRAHRDEVEPVLTLNAPRTIIWRLRGSPGLRQTASASP